MSKGFDDCIKNGGKLRKKNLRNNRFINICYDKSGKSHAGEVMIRKQKNKPKLTEAERQKESTNKSEKLTASLKNLQEHFNTKYRI